MTTLDGVVYVAGAAGVNLELYARGGPGTFLKLNYAGPDGTERTGLAVTTGTDAPVVSVAPEANGAGTLDLENNDLAGVVRVLISPDAGGGMLYAEGGALKWRGGASGAVTVLGAP